MNKDFIIDYSSCILFRLLGPLIRALPGRFVLFLGRRIGDLLYYFDFKHKAVAYSNLKTAFASKFSPAELNKLAHKFYQALAQNFMEIFLIPLVDKKYFDKYVSFEGRHFIDQAFKRGKGLIFITMHAGNWELSNFICANLGFPFNFFVREQRYPRLDSLLNKYRAQKGCKLILRHNQTRQLIQALKNNEAVGMSADQGGKEGVLVKFFGKDASMATGAIRLALKYDAVILPAYYTRLEGPYMKTVLEPPVVIKKTGNLEEDIKNNLQAAMPIFEKNIAKYPKDYLWTYKIWKYTKEQNILILGDGRTGHLRQAQALAKIASEYLKGKEINTYISQIEVEFKDKFAQQAIAFSSCLAGKYHCQGCLWCLRMFLKEPVYRALITQKPDIIISCGSAVAPINFILSRENLAKSIVIMRPALLSTHRFDLVVMPRHDKAPRRKNICVTEGALNLVDTQYLKEQSEKLSKLLTPGSLLPDFYIGLLVGGDTKNFILTPAVIAQVLKQVKSLAEKLNAGILVTTSRRTPGEVEGLLQQELKNYPRLSLLVIANEKNIAAAVGGILGLSQFVITSPESISMVSEATSSRKYVIVFQAPGLSQKHQRFLKNFAKNKYIYLTEAADLARTIEDIWMHKPPIDAPDDNLVVREALEKIL